MVSFRCQMWTCYELLLGYFIRCPPFAYNVYCTCVKCGIFVTLILQLSLLFSLYPQAHWL